MFQNGDVLFRLHKPKPFNPFCGIEWHLSDDINANAPAIVVKKGLLASSTTFEAADGLLLTTMTQKMFSPHCEFTFEDCTYR